MTDTPDQTAAQCTTCNGAGMAWQWRTYGDCQYHGEYFEPCDDCLKGQGIARAGIRKIANA